MKSDTGKSPTGERKTGKRIPVNCKPGSGTDGIGYRRTANRGVDTGKLQPVEAEGESGQLIYNYGRRKAAGTTIVKL